MKDIKLKDLASTCDLIKVCLGQWDNHLMVSALPGWIAAVVLDIGLEIAIVWESHSLELWWSGSDHGVWRLEMVEWVSESHS